MKEPNLMPFQNEPFNGDRYIEQEFLKLKARFNIRNAVETGTCLGSTTIFLSNNFEKVYTIEISRSFLNIARQKFISHKNIEVFEGDSVEVLSNNLNHLNDQTIYFLDAHWLDNCPLKNELCAIKGRKPVIVIHDFYVPGSSLGYDSYNGQPFTFEWLKPQIDAIYDGYEYYYNTDEKSEGAKRGVLYITPK